jgi:hypothetical protein
VKSLIVFEVPEGSRLQEGSYVAEPEITDDLVMSTERSVTYRPCGDPAV